jgi:hypothetical protein
MDACACIGGVILRAPKKNNTIVNDQCNVPMSIELRQKPRTWEHLHGPSGILCSVGGLPFETTTRVFDKKNVSLLGRGWVSPIATDSAGAEYKAYSFNTWL